MISIVIVAITAILTLSVINRTELELVPVSSRLGKRLQRLWEIAQDGIKESKYLRAEKALLTILSLDEKNAAAYSRLGILYSRQKEYKDAIECFEAASTIDPTASSLHNLGLIYFETENYEKAALAFEGALALDEELAARHIAYAKVQEKIGDYDLVEKHLLRAVELEPAIQTYSLLKRVYELVGKDDEVKKIDKKLERLENKDKKRRRISRPRKINY